MDGKILTVIVLFTLLACSREDPCFCDGKNSYKIQTEADYDACYKLENYNIIC